MATENAAGNGSPCATCFLMLGGLGNVRVVADGNGNIYGRHDYLPFGEETSSTDPNRPAASGFGLVDDVMQRFTGKERDSESGLDYFGARYYGSALGRFSSPDPGSAGVDITDPQSWNAYAYVGNNPLAYPDPTGMAQEDANGSCKPEDGCFSVVKTVHLSWWEKLKSLFSGGGMAATIRPGNPMQYRRAWEKANPGQQFPRDASGNNLDADHDIPISEGGDPLD